TPEPSPLLHTPPPRRWLLGAGLAVVVAAVCVTWLLQKPGRRGASQVQAQSTLSRDEDTDDPEEPIAFSVNTIVPHKKTLVPTLEQPGSIKPWAQAELYAKISGYLKHIAREPVPPELFSEWAPQHLSFLAHSTAPSPFAQVARVMAGRQLSQWQAPFKDIGSPVRARGVLLEIDVPELIQDIAQKESLLKQAEAELLEARANIATFEAGVVLQTKQFARTKNLAENNTIAKELVDEKQAELAVVTSKLAAAR